MRNTINSTVIEEIINVVYLPKANTASKGVITGAKKSLLSSRAVWAQETYTKTSHCKNEKIVSQLK